jgi:hypothetical protein
MNWPTMNRPCNESRPYDDLTHVESTRNESTLQWINLAMNQPCDESTLRWIDSAINRSAMNLLSMLSSNFGFSIFIANKDTK